LLSFSFAIAACSHLLAPICIHHHRLLPLASSHLHPPSLLAPTCMPFPTSAIIAYFSLCALAYFHHHHLLPLACFHHHCVFKYLAYFHLLHHLLACFVVCLFEFQVHPLCLLLIPLSICAGGGTLRGKVATYNLVF
jgi:hypothetical protein